MRRVERATSPSTNTLWLISQRVTLLLSMTMDKRWQQSCTISNNVQKWRLAVCNAEWNAQWPKDTAPADWAMPPCRPEWLSNEHSLMYAKLTYRVSDTLIQLHVTLLTKIKNQKKKLYVEYGYWEFRFHPGSYPGHHCEQWMMKNIKTANF